MIKHGCHISQEQQFPQAVSQISTWQELKAVHKVLGSLTNNMRNYRVSWFTDKQNPNN